MRVRFGDCLIDTDTRELFRGDKAAHLPPTAFRLLELLVESRPKALSKDQIHEKVWPGVFISEATLASAISDIRIAIGDIGKKPRFIRTIHGFGYAFKGETGKVRALAQGARAEVEWRLICDDREVSLSQGVNVLGRDHEAAIWIDSESVSRRHAVIVVEGQRVFLEDLSSKNGTYVNGRPINERTLLKDGDRVHLGASEMMLKQYLDRVSTRTGRPVSTPR